MSDIEEQTGDGRRVTGANIQSSVSGRRPRLIPLSDYLEDLRAALLVGDEVTWSLLLRNYRVCDHGAQLITELSCRHESLGGLRPW